MKYAYHGSVLTLLLLVAGTMGVSALPASTATPEPEKAPTPQLVISFERGTLRENDQLPIRVLISNASDKDLQNVSLGWDTLPGTLAMYNKPCTQLGSLSSEHAVNEVAVGKLPAQQDSLSIHPVDLCLTSTTVTNGDYNLLFTLRYDWTATVGPRHAILTLEKPIKSAFLGTDSLAGVPLALAGFIVPGLLFWLALDFWKTPWRIQGPTLGDKTVYSVLVSLFLVAFVSVSPIMKGYFDITQGLSLKKLEYLALLGGGAGLIVGWFDRLIRAAKTRRLLHPNDDDITLLIKLLRLNIGRNQPKTRVKLSNGQTYEGAVAGQSADRTFLVGWYGIRKDPHQQQQTGEIQTALAASDFPLAAELAKRYQSPLDTGDFIYQQGADGAFAPTTNMRMEWANTDVVGQPTVSVGNNPPIAIIK